MIDGDGILFGISEYGGAYGYGSLFSINYRNRTLATIYSLQGGLSGAFPEFSPLYQDGALYGTTDGFYSNGNQGDDGLVYKFDLTSGQWTVLHLFQTQDDGIFPGALVYHDGFLYGTSLEGGGTGCAGGDGCGLVFKVDATTGKEKILYTFTSTGTSPIYPQGVTYQNGQLYGATLGDGTYGMGSIYKLDPNTGTKTTLYSFKGGHDASLPNSLLTYHDGALYGTTGYFSGGGTYGCYDTGNVCGAVFKIDITTGTETILRRFKGGRDGALPEGGVIYQDGALYGTARTGGINGTECSGYGCGTVFKITLPDEKQGTH